MIDMGDDGDVADVVAELLHVRQLTLWREANSSLERDGRKPLQRLGARVDDNPNGLKRDNAQDGLSAFRSEDDAARGHFAHELDLRETEGVLMKRSVRKLVRQLARWLDADALKLRRR